MTQKLDIGAEIVPNGKRPLYNQLMSVKDVLLMWVKYMEHWTLSYGPAKMMGWGWHWKKNVESQTLRGLGVVCIP